ncbi:protein GVQW3-like [Trichomycterus rosablanca]|uniref:protein GVQW3-like n=1 Tax=Trichomycterus rosablanca TaxID=2290929 RepID=UPI002F35AA4E
MAAKLLHCTKDEQRSVIRFLWAEGVPGAQIHRRMCAQYGDKVLSRRVVYEWIEMFENGRTNVKDAERSGRPTTATTTKNEERTLELILENRTITVEEIAEKLNLSVGSAYALVHNSLKFSKVGTMWVPKQLTEEHKRKRLDSHEEGDNFLQQIITGDETLVHHDEPESKPVLHTAQSMQ